MVGHASDKLPAHRPSRRHLIIEAAVRVFARQGFVEASVQDVAEEAQVVPNAIYYHFAGKEELFDAALCRAMEQLDEAIDKARRKAAARDGNALKVVTEATWDWLEAHPAEGDLLHNHLPGFTPRTQALWKEFEDRQVRRALDGVTVSRDPRPGNSATASRAAQTFAGRTLMTLLIMVHPLRMPGGTLSPYSARTLRKAVSDVALSISLPNPAASS